MKTNLWLNVLLSSFLFNIAYFWPQYFAFCVLISFYPVYLICKDLKAGYFNIYCAGFFWGLLAIGGHIFWFLILFLKKSTATPLQSFLIYFAFVFYISLTSGFWFLISNFSIKKVSNKFKNKFLHLLTFFLISFLYFKFLINYASFVLGECVRYPFISPLIPLSSYKWFLKCIFIVSSLINFGQEVQKKTFNLDGEGRRVKLLYLKPDRRKEYLAHPAIAAQRIYQKLAKLKLQRFSKSTDLILIFAPESTFPFALNKHPEAIEMWSNLFSDNVYFLIGSNRENRGKIFQTIYLVCQGRIMKHYDKQHLIPLTETLPTIWKNFSFTKQLFLCGKNQISLPGFQERYFQIRNMRIYLNVCSDFFCRQTFKDFKLNENYNNLICCFLNDSWFVNYFKNLMKNYAYYQSVKLNSPILYIAHSGMDLISGRMHGSRRV
jgi:apolipoprotein N-acyltransferase